MTAPESDQRILLCEPDIGEILQEFGNSSEFLTFWSLEPAYQQDQLRYHLGQLGMLQLVNDLTARGCRAATYLCDADRSLARYLSD